MRKLTALLLFTFLFSSLYAQGLAGIYTITGQGGTITLALDNPTPDKVQGTLTDMQGLIYRAEAEMKDGKAFGTLTTKQGVMFFEAFRKGTALNLTLIPPDADAQPDFSDAREFILTASNALAPDPISRALPDKAAGGQVGGPMSSSLQDRQVPEAPSWPGTYSGNIMGTATTMTLQRKEDQLSGPVDAGGYRYQIEGTVADGQSEGKLIDPQTEGYLNYTANLQGDQLSMTIKNPTNGQSQQVVFNRTGAVSLKDLKSDGSGRGTGNQ